MRSVACQQRLFSREVLLYFEIVSLRLINLSSRSEPLQSSSSLPPSMFFALPPMGLFAMIVTGTYEKGPDERGLLTKGGNNV